MNFCTLLVFRNRNKQLVMRRWGFGASETNSSSFPPAASALSQ
jgi:hypothetical protein